MSFVSKIFNSRLLYTLFLPLLALLASFHNMFYNTNDDQVMRSIIEGSMFGLPNEYVLFINVIYTRLLTFLYGKFPDFYWYDTFFLSFIFVAGMVLAYAFSQKIENKFYKLFITCFLFLALRTSFNQIQFSIVAGFLAMSCIVSCWYILLNEVSKKEIITLSLYTFFAFFLASLIRFEMALLTLAVGGLFSILLINKSIFQTKNYITCSLLVLSLIFAYIAHNYNQMEYAKIVTPHNPMEYNNIKTEILDKSRGVHLDKETLMATLTKHNLSYNDYRALVEWGFTGSYFFGIDEMRQYAKGLSSTLQGRNFDTLPRFYQYFVTESSMFFYSIFLFCLFVANSRSIKKIFCQQIMFLTLLFVLCFFMKTLPFRVIFPLFLLNCSFAFIIANRDFCLSNVLMNIKKIFIYKDNIVLALSKYWARSKSKNVYQSRTNAVIDYMEKIKKDDKIFAKANLFKFGIFLILLYSLIKPYDLYHPQAREVYKQYALINIAQDMLANEQLFFMDSIITDASIIPLKPSKEFLKHNTGFGWPVALAAFHEKLQGKDFYKMLHDMEIKYIMVNDKQSKYKYLLDIHKIFLEEHFNVICAINWEKKDIFSIGTYDCN